MKERNRRYLHAIALIAAITFLPFALPSAGAAQRGSTAARRAHQTERQRKEKKVRQELHRNLDGKGDGFIVGFSFDARTFYLDIDASRYEQNMLTAATMTARSIFDSNDLVLPATLVIRDRSGKHLGSGPFSNVPKIFD